MSDDSFQPSDKRKYPSQKFGQDELLNADTGVDVDELDVKRQPIRKFLNKKENNGRATDTVGHLERDLREFEAFVYHEFDEHICNIDNTHVRAFNKHLKAEGDRDRFYTIQEWWEDTEYKKIDIGDQHRHTTLSSLVSFYDWLKINEVVTTNPTRKAMEEFDDDEFDLTPPGRRRIELHEMQEFLQWIENPLARAISLTFLKTGIRLGELCNIDLQCLHIGNTNGTNTHPLYQHVIDRRDVTLKSEIQNKPDTLYIYPSFNEDSTVEGETRKHGNKRKKDEGTVIPLDSELKTALIEYLLVRRPADRHETAFPLFTKTSSQGNKDRISEHALYSMLTGRDEVTGILFEYGWYESGAPTEENVTPHYFRHYFSDNHKHNHGVHHDHMPIGVIAYIRGDTDDSAVTGGDRQDAALHKNYSHDDWMNWKRNVRKPYLDGIYKFGVYDEVIPAAGEGWKP